MKYKFAMFAERKHYMWGYTIAMPFILPTVKAVNQDA